LFSLIENHAPLKIYDFSLSTRDTRAKLVPGIDSNAVERLIFFPDNYLIDLSYIMFIMFITYIDLRKGGD